MSKKMSKAFVPEEFKEKRKKHKKRKEKHVKKLKEKKSRKKTKMEKHEANMLEKIKKQYCKHNYCSKEFIEKITGRDVALIKKILGKLINKNESETMKSIPELFESIENGDLIDIDGIEDPYVKSKINKIFKLFRFKRDDESKLEYRKHKKYHDFNLKKFIVKLLEDAKEELENQKSDSESEGESDSSDLSGDKGSQQESGDENEDKLVFRDPRVKNEDDEEVGPALVDYKPDPNHQIPEEDPDEYLDETMKMIKREYEKEQEFKGEVEDTIANIFGDSDKRKDKKKKKNHNILYLGAHDKELNEEEEEDRQRVHEDFMEKYNQKYRTKSLLEEHEHKKRVLKAKAKGEYRPFDREKDLQGISSKEAFKAMYSKNELSSRFDNNGSKFY